MGSIFDKLHLQAKGTQLRCLSQRFVLLLQVVSSRARTCHRFLHTCCFLCDSVGSRAVLSTTGEGFGRSRFKVLCGPEKLSITRLQIQPTRSPQMRTKHHQPPTNLQGHAKSHMSDMFAFLLVHSEPQKKNRYGITAHMETLVTQTRTCRAASKVVRQKCEICVRKGASVVTAAYVQVPCQFTFCALTMARLCGPIRFCVLCDMQLNV